MENKIKLLIVDDEENIRELMKLHFNRRGFSVLTANSGLQAVTCAKENSPHIMLLDKRMPEMDGIEALGNIRGFNQDIKVIIISGDELDSDTQSQIKELNVSAYMLKPVDIADLDNVIGKITSM
ncbi:MAG: response regulator [Candidatus Omnitrophota bacterium]